MAKTSIDGSIIERGKGVWEVQLSLGCDPLTGKYRKASKRIHGSRRDASRALKELVAQRDSGTNLLAGQVTLSEMVELWLNAKRTSGTCSETHLGNLKTQLAHVEKYLGGTPVSKITPVSIERVYAAIRTECGLSGTTMKKIHTALKSVFEKAVDYELITRNPCRNVTAPRNDQVDRRSLNDVEVAKLRRGIEELYKAEHDRFKHTELHQVESGNAFGRTALEDFSSLSYTVAVRVILATGIRRGEAVALRWRDIDFGKSSISVRQSLSKDGKPKAPKSTAGFRTLAIDARTLQALDEWKQTQAVYLRKLGITQSRDTPVACSGTGDYIRSGSMGQWWIRTRVKLGFPTLKLHELRHTQATLLLAHGVDLKTVQHRLGHSSAALTLGTYAHAVPANDSEAAEVIGGLLDTEAGENEEVVMFKTA